MAQAVVFTMTSVVLYLLSGRIYDAFTIKKQLYDTNRDSVLKEIKDKVYLSAVMNFVIINDHSIKNDILKEINGADNCNENSTLKEIKNEINSNNCKVNDIIFVSIIFKMCRIYQFTIQDQTTKLYVYQRYIIDESKPPDDYTIALLGMSANNPKLIDVRIHLCKLSDTNPENIIMEVRSKFLKRLYTHRDTEFYTDNKSYGTSIYSHVICDFREFSDAHISELYWRYSKYTNPLYTIDRGYLLFTALKLETQFVILSLGESDYYKYNAYIDYSHVDDAILHHELKIDTSGTVEDIINIFIHYMTPYVTKNNLYN